MTILRVLFVCVGNSCRSPMAEAIANQLGGDKVEAHSAGLSPAGRIAGNTLKTLASLGYIGDALYSKGFDDIDTEDFDVVVSLLGKQGLELLPLSFGARREAWAIPDPIGEDVDIYLDVARKIELHIRQLLLDEFHEELLLP